ncbi:hypothetical protein JKP88DRAFT_193912 [Tribonema minus]|uniref:Uncharacterized protein n=1 Tax=Tribonema minus TaxID=303371 RepID=A0A836CJ19_9STRA|nr:hypothetical protein JKP88DRAFT_193912 [Tribonema minus]
MAAGEEEKKGGLPFWLDPSTRGGAVVVPVLSVLLPIAAYFVLTSQGMDGLKAGNYVTVTYILLGMVGWAGTYFFRVATKNMTYAQQLRDYEQAVIQKRFEELQEDEVEALLDEIDEDATAEKVNFD